MGVLQAPLFRMRVFILFAFGGKKEPFIINKIMTILMIIKEKNKKKRGY
jgi:hypothetical protein